MNNTKSPSYISDVAILVIEPDIIVWQKLEPILRLSFGFVKHAKTVEQATVSFRRFHYDLTIIESTLLKGFWRSLASAKQQTITTSHSRASSQVNTADFIAELCFPLNFMVVSRSSEPESIIDILRMGACDFLSKPLIKIEVEMAIIRWQLRLSQHKSAKITADDNEHHSLFVGDSEAVRSIRQRLYEVSLCVDPLLIEGEAGTGKKLAVKQLQQFSAPQSHIFSIDCRNLSQIDWHKAACFCNESKVRSLLVIAHIDLLSIVEQTELLQLLNSQAIENNKFLRIISLSESSLLSLVQRRRFLDDLYYRIAVVNVKLSPLNQRSEDIVLLVRFFTNQILIANVKCNDEIISRYYSWQAADFFSLTEHYWPGNIQELKSTIEQCLLLNISPHNYFKQTQFNESDLNQTERYFPIEWSIKQIEKAHILRVMKIYQDNRILAAEHLGVTRKTIDRKLNEWSQDPTV
jgi:DNA-binding NtrC family response regulator